MNQNPLKHSSKHYIRLTVRPAADALTIRKSLSNTLNETFGTTAASVNIDVLWVEEDGSEAVVRMHPDDAPKVLSAVVSSSGSPKLSLIRESPVLSTLGVKQDAL
ncbi:hypothetical protein FA13DRAFT_1730155 [Coprinellus micaceus]|uniref:Ribonucleases P/MRP subunit Pop8-like domain-containing protein n=1 Tax=Coprinellus micaceus TaxID=71717 RepID=A0A4Y7TI73_COPMI|nr:hypothetical protein FA13DRAFT_1730155 [Coprinellus micaceus]